MSVSFKPKIKVWAEALEDIEDALTEAKERPAIVIPYGLQLENNLWNPENLRLSLHISQGGTGSSFITHQGVGKNNKINIWNIKRNREQNISETSLRTIHIPHKFKHLIFITKRWMYVTFSADLTLQCFSSKFVHMSTAFTGQTVLSLQYNSKRDEILTGGTGGIVVWHFPVKQTDPLVPGQVIDCSFEADEWAKVLYIDRVFHQMIVISNEKIAVVRMEDYRCLISFTKNYDIAFTACVLYHPYKYFITGDKNGSIKLWSTTLTSLPLVMQFLGHCDAITSLLIHPNEPLLVSSSMDKTIRIWNFDTFTQTFCLQTGEEVIRMELINTEEIFYQSQKSIKVWHMNLFHTLFTTLSSRIVKFKRVTSPEFPSRILVYAVDGGVRLISPVHGYELTTMLPITKLNSKMVDVCHDRKKEKLYVVLENGSVLVFDSDANPCCASQLWKSESPDEGVCSIGLINAECALDFDVDLDLACGLLFAGLYNGQITLLDSLGVQMESNVQAHQGQVIQLCTSNALTTSRDQIGSRDRLVSLGTDNVIRVWIVRHPRERVIEIEAMSEVRLMTLPMEIAMIGNTLCMIMSNHKVVMCRVKVKPTNIFSKENHVEFLFHSKDESHTAPINGLSCCPAIELFATSSEDQSVKLWNLSNQLIRELSFDETLCGVCFATARGDLLVGFQSHISLVTLVKYLPGSYLEMLSGMHFENELMERNVQFDDHLRFWYDPKEVPTLPLELKQRRPLLPPETPPCPFEEEADSELSVTPEPSVEEDGLNWLRQASRRVSILSRMTLSSRLSMVSRLDDQRQSVIGAKVSSVMDALNKDSVQSIASMKSLQHLQFPPAEDPAELIRFNEWKKERAEQKAACRPPKYWACAPDGFIPNSVIRGIIRLKPVPPHMVPRIVRPIKPKKEKKKKKAKVKKDEEDEEYLSDEWDYFEAIKKKARKKLMKAYKKIKRLKTQAKGEKLSTSPSDGKRKGSNSGKSAQRIAELRARRRSTLPSIHPDAIFEEMSAEDENDEDEEDTKDGQIKTGKQVIAPQATHDEKQQPKTVPGEPDLDEYALDLGERDANYRSTSSSEEEDEEYSEESEGDEEEAIGMKINFEDDVVKQLSLKPKAGPRPSVEYSQREYSLLERIARSYWFPKRGSVTEIKLNETLNGIIEALLLTDPKHFKDICDAVWEIHREIGIPQDRLQVILSLLLKKTMDDNPQIRGDTMELFLKLRVKMDDILMAAIRALSDEDERVRELAMQYLRELYGINNMDDLTKLFIELGIIRITTDCQDPVVLNELYHRFQITKYEQRTGYAGDTLPTPRKARRSTTVRSPRMFATDYNRRKSLKVRGHGTIACSSTNLMEDLHQSPLGCKLLGMLGSGHSRYMLGDFAMSSRHNLPNLDIKGESLLKENERLLAPSLSPNKAADVEMFRRKAMENPSPEIQSSPSVGLLKSKTQRHVKRLGSLIRLGVEADSDIKTRQEEPHDVPRGQTPIIPCVDIVSSVDVDRGQESSASKGTPGSGGQQTKDDRNITIDELLDMLHCVGTTKVGRIITLAVLGMKRENSKQTFKLDNVLNTIKELQSLKGNTNPHLDDVKKLLKGSIISKTSKWEKEERKTMEKRTKLKSRLTFVEKTPHKVKAGISVHGFLRQDTDTSRDGLPAIRSRELETGESSSQAGDVQTEKSWIQTPVKTGNMPNFLPPIEPEKPTAISSEQVDISDLIMRISAVSNSDERKELTKNILVNALKDKESRSRLMVMRTPKIIRRVGTVSRRRQQGKPKQASKLDIDRQIAKLKTPLRNCLAPGIRGQRLVHSMGIKRPQPSCRSIDSVPAERIVGSLPQRLSFYTAGPCDWGQSSFGILEVTWTSLAPLYGTDNEASRGIKGIHMHVHGPYEQRFGNHDKDENDGSDSTNGDHGSIGNDGIKGYHGNRDIKHNDVIPDKRMIFRKRLKEVSSIIPHFNSLVDPAVSDSPANPPARYITIEDTYVL